MTEISWQANLFIILMVVAATPLSAIIAILAWKRRNSPSAKSFFVMMLGVTVWSFGYALELVVVSLASKSFCASIKYFGIILVPTAFLAFALQYSGKRERLPLRIIAFLAIEPLITILGVWTNDSHGLFWTHIRLETFDNLRVRVATHGILFWVHLIYSYLFILVGTILLLQMVIRTQTPFRKQTFFTLIGVVTPWVGNAIYVSGRNPFHPFDSTPFAFVLTGYFLGYSILRYRLLNIVPVAHRVLIESINDAVMVLDSSNRIVELNPAAKHLTGYLAPMIIGKPVVEILPALQDLPQFHQEASAGRSEVILDQDKTRRYFDLGVWPLYGRVGRLRGRLVVLRDITEKKLAEEALRKAHDELEKRVERRTAQLLEANEKLAKEIEDRKQIEEENRRTQKFLHSIVENIPNMIFIKNAKELRFIYCNKAAEDLMGCSREKFMGKNAYEFFSKEEADFITGKEQEVLETRNLVDIPEEVLLTKPKGVRILHTKIMPILDEGGTPQFLLGIAEDVTERKRAEEELQRAQEILETRVQERTVELVKANNDLEIEIMERRRTEEELNKAKEAAEGASRAKSEFLANMSHELRTPLNHIIGFTELVVDKQFGALNEAQEEYLNDVLHSSRHLLSLINDILDLSKVEAGKLELELADVNLRMLLEKSLTMVKEKALKHRIRLSVDIDGILDTIQADERKLKQIMYNLLSNAVKFTPDGGSVILSARYLSSTDGQWFTREGQPVGLPLNGDDQLMSGEGLINISVQDTGIGIKREDLERIFNPFEQVESSASRRYQGTGLGLTLTKRLVELHGGKIWAESEGEGKGSKFIFVILA